MSIVIICLLIVGATLVAVFAVLEVRTTHSCNNCKCSTALWPRLLLFTYLL